MDPRSSKPNSRPTVRRPHTDTAAPHETGANAKDLPRSADDAFLEPPQKPGEIGRLGPYRILGVIGRGGMGAVYRAEDPRLHRPVAIKVLLPELASDARSKARFRREAQAQAKVDHDNIIPIYEVEEANGVVYIAMPLLKGQALSTALRQNPRPPLNELVRIGRETAEGLAAAHAVGLIHRDIKPANIWLEGSKRRVKILDFGLARGAGSAFGSGGGALTEAGAIMGTPAYMSPEQARCQPVDHRSDIFSLGILLHEMATGRKPFTGESAFDVMAAVVASEPPPVAELVPELPPELSTLIQRMLAKNPDDRPQTCEEIAERLEEIARGLTALPVVVVPLAAVPGEPDPWAEIDTTHAEAIVTAAHRTRSDDKPARPRAAASPKWLWPVIGTFGALALLAIVVLAVSLLKPKKQETVEEPKPKEKATSGTQVIQQKPKTNPVASTPDRKALEWVRSVGGSALVRHDGIEKYLQTTDPLPSGNLELLQATVSENAKVTDAGLANFKGCQSLMYIDLTGTQTGNSGLAHLADLPALRVVLLKGTGVDGAGVTAFAVARPDCKITWGDGQVIEPKDPPAPDRTPDRRAAEWVLSVGGAVKVNDARPTDNEILAPAELPKEPFRLTYVRLRGNAKVTDDALAVFKGCAELTVLGLDSTQVTDAGLEHFRGLKALTHLYLPGAKITNDGLTVFKDCQNLLALGLSQTPVDDKATKALSGFTQLQQLDIQNTKITAAGFADLKAALPDCAIYWNGVAFDPPAKATAGLAFDGKSTFVKVPKLSFDGKLPITIEAWLTPETVDGTERHVCLLGEPGGGLGFSKDGALGAGFFDGTKWHSDFSRVKLVAGQKVHVAAVVSKDRILLFIDGKEVGTKAVTLGAPPATKAPTLIGKPTEKASGTFFHGTIHGLRVSNTARYAKDFKPPETVTPDAATVLLYFFDEGKGTKLTDRSKNRYDGEIENGTWVEPKK